VKNISIPLDPMEGKAWTKAHEKEINANKLYQVIQGDKDDVEPNARGELIHGSPYQ